MVTDSSPTINISGALTIYACHFHWDVLTWKDSELTYTSLSSSNVNKGSVKRDKVYLTRDKYLSFEVFDQSTPLTVFTRPVV